MRRVALTLSCLAVALAATPSAMAAGWLTPAQPVSPGGTDAVAPLRVAADSGKNLFLAWKRGDVVDVAVRPAGGSFGIASLYGCPTNPPTFCSSARDADVAVDSDGNAIVVFVLDGLLKAFVRPADGSFTQLDDIASGLPSDSKPRVALTGDGTAIVVWQLADGLQAAERAPGGSFGAPTPIYTESGGEDVVANAFDLATGGAVDATVAFVTHKSGSSSQTAALRSVERTPAGWLAPSEVTHEGVGSDLECFRTIQYGVPAIAMDVDGEAAVAFEVFKSSSSSGSCVEPLVRFKIVTARRLAPFAGWSSPDEFDDVPTGSGSPATTFSSQARPLAAWLKTDAAGMSSVRYAAGAPGGPGFGTAADVPGSAVPPAEGLGQTAVVPLPGGAAMVGFIHVTTMGWTLEYATRPAGGPFGQPSEAAAMTTLPTGLALAATPAGDVVAAWLQDDASSIARARSLIYDASPPVMGDVQVPAGGESGQPLAMSATATDAFSPVSFGWKFGDGATATGAQASHAFSSVGTFGVSVTATDAAGNASSAGRNVAVADPDPAFLGGLDLARPRFRAAPSGESAIPARRRRRAPVGTIVSFRLSEAGTVRFTVARARQGRRVRGRCVKPTRTNRKRRRCTRYVKQRGSFTVAGVEGATRFRFTGRLRKRKLRPGRYRLVGVATDATGKRSAPEGAKFRIVPR